MPTERSRSTADNSGLLDLFDPMVLWRRKWTIVACVVAAAAAGGLYISRETPVFEVTARVLVQLERFGNEKEALIRTDRTFLVTQGEIASCPIVVQKALESLTTPPGKAPDFDEIDAVLRTLRVSTVDDANVLKLTYRNADPQHASRLLAAIVESYHTYVKEMQQGTITETIQALAKRDIELRKELDRLQEKFLALRKNSPLLGNGAEGFRTHAAMLEQLGTRLTAATTRRIDRETQLQSLVQNGAVPDPTTLSLLLPVTAALHLEGAAAGNGGGNPVANAGETAKYFPIVETAPKAVPDAVGDLQHIASSSTWESFTDPVALQEQLWKAEAKAKQLAQTFGPKHKEMKAMQAEIEMWRQRIRDCEQAAPVVLSLQLDALKRIEEHLTKLYEQEFQKVKALDVSLLQEQQALAAIERVQAIYDTNTEQLRELQLADDALTNGQVAMAVRILQPAEGTAKLVWPRPLQFIALCSALGFALGTVLVILSTRLTRAS